MRASDQLRFSWQVFRGQRLRTGLLVVAVAIGVAAVVMLTSLGEGARRYITAEFSALGNRLLIVFPGRNETTGGRPPLYGVAPRDLTLEDARAMARLPAIQAMAPIVAGTTVVGREARSREVMTIGTSPSFFTVRQVAVGRGRILPESAENQASAVCVLGATLAKELFGTERAVGEWIRVGERRMRVVGVLRDEGQSLGMDFDDMIIIPVRTAEQLFDSPALFRVLLELREGVDMAAIKERLLQVVRERHEGEDDVTLVSQDSMLESFDNILATLTLVIAAIAAISLVVAGVLIMNISLIAVSQRRREIGLLEAIGASGDQVRQLFLGEALVLASVGSVVGVVVAYSAVAVVRQLWPVFPIAAPWWAAPAATLTAVVTGVLFSWLPASRAARLDPVLALKGQA